MSSHHRHCYTSTPLARPTVIITGTLICLLAVLLCSTAPARTTGAMTPPTGSPAPSSGVAPAGDPAGETDASITAVTFNIRYDTASDGVHAWPHRRDNLIELVRSFDADLVGYQEVLQRQLDTLREAFEDEMTFLGVGRDDGETRGEFSPLAFRTDRFELIEWGTWWLSPTPDRPSRGWDAALPRIATWARLRDRSTDTALLAVSTHFDHRGAEARLESARLLVDKLADEPRVILLGDFNARPNSPPHTTFTAAFTDAAGDDDRATWCGWSGQPQPGARIDWILLRGYSATRYDVPAWRNPEKPESDHLPVIATLTLSTDPPDAVPQHDDPPSDG